MRKLRCLVRVVALPLALLAPLACQPSSVPTNPTPEDHQVALERASRYEAWIARMTPFMKEDEDGTWTFDEVGFFGSLSPERSRLDPTAAGLTADDRAVIDDLRNSLSTGNEMRRDGVVDGARSALRPEGSSTSWHWWGRRVCYWGSTADYMVAHLTMAAFVFYFYPPAAAVLGAYAWWADFLNRNCPAGGFSVSCTWNGYLWLGCR